MTLAALELSSKLVAELSLFVVPAVAGIFIYRRQNDMATVVAAEAPSNTDIPKRLLLDLDMVADEGANTALAGGEIRLGCLKWSTLHHDEKAREFLGWALALGVREGKAVRDGRR